MSRYSDFKLRLKPRWFTGEEWILGLAERELIAEYRIACKHEEEIENAKPAGQRETERKAKRFQKWFEWSVQKDSRER
jgi:hypothetical protein